MKILVVGNVLKDVYLNLDERAEDFERDRRGVKWLNLSFDASEYRFFNREVSMGGAAVSFEVLVKLGMQVRVGGFDLRADGGDLVMEGQGVGAHRYILVTDGQPCYIVPAEYLKTEFVAPDDYCDYIYVDRSAEISEKAAERILKFLEFSRQTKLVVYVRRGDNTGLNRLMEKADLVFREGGMPSDDEGAPEAEKTVYLTENEIRYLGIREKITVERVDIMTHLSMYSVAAATVLGCFMLGKSVEESLRLAKINVENARLDATLKLEELQELAENMPVGEDIELVAANLMLAPKGILAADESGGSIAKKFARMEIADTYENRRNYRNIFFTTPDLEQFVNGVILFDETARQLADNGQNFVEYLTARRVIPGIKVDQGLEEYEGTGEKVTKGLEGLEERLAEYYRMGLRFAKWRTAFEVKVGEGGEVLTPTEGVILENCRRLAEYAMACQKAGLVPIVEPEVVHDGAYTIEQCAEVTGRVLDVLFEELEKAGVNLAATILKVNMVLAGKQMKEQSSATEVGKWTAEVLRAHVPAGLAGVVFLSGGQTPEQATENLAEVMRQGSFPWPVTFSFARALQEPALVAWAGDNARADEARRAFHDRLVENWKALTGDVRGTGDAQERTGDARENML